MSGCIVFHEQTAHRWRCSRALCRWHTADPSTVLTRAGPCPQCGAGELSYDDRLILGIDPGPTRSGWALLDIFEIRRRVLDCGHSTTAEVIAALGSRWTNVGLLMVAIETPGHMHPRGSPAALVGRANGLIATTRVSAELAGAAERVGLRVMHIRAIDWRRGIVGGKGNASDAQVKAALSLQLVGLPGRTSSHCRDAMGVAMACAAVRYSHTWPAPREWDPETLKLKPRKDGTP